MNQDNISRIIEIESYLTTKVIDNRGKGYQPNTEDEDQPLRDELLKLRIKEGIIKVKKEEVKEKEEILIPKLLIK